MFQHFITSHFINLILTDSVYMTVLMANGLVLLLNLFVHYFSNESSESLSRLENHPNIRGTQRQFSENICSEDDLRSRIFETFVVKFLACLPLLGFSNV